LPHREYSIASIPEDGAIHLLVRLMRRPDGSPGIGSGWLTGHAPIGAPVRLRVRTNTNFHVPDDARPMIMVGNGSGIAGLRALLKQRIARGHHRNWLLFGERNAAHDFHYRDEILRWRDQGCIERLDLAFSRDHAERMYVQHRLAASASVLRAWIDEGAAVYVCGSLKGMAPGVHAVLADVLGTANVERLQAEGRYRRDVY
jgi:sulfite reductase (NADPH) flavoprotein alpha-component